MAARSPFPLLLLFVASSALAAPGSPPPGYTLARVSDGVPIASRDAISQLAFQPGDPSRLYAARPSNGSITRYDVNPATRFLSNPVEVATGLPVPYGLAFRDADLYVSLNPANDGRIARLRDLDLDGTFEERVDFLRGVPLKDHGIDQLDIAGSMLIAGIGTRSNGGSPTCEFVYNGTIGRIADLDQVDYSGVGNALPSATEYVNAAPVDGMLRRHAYGFRNPFGVRVDAIGRVWVSDNGASFCNTCSACSNFAIDTPDFLYRDVPMGAKGRFPPEGYPGGGGATIVPFSTLGIHAAATGFAFLTVGPDSGLVILGQFGPTDTSIPVGRDFIAVDPMSGVATPFISGFNRPTDVLEDAFGRLWIADYAEPAIYLLTPPGLVAVEPRAPGDLDGVARLIRLHPNPARGEVTLEYAIARATVVSLRIFDAAGRSLATLPLGWNTAGRQVARWNVDDARAGMAAPGIYYCRVETPFESSARQLVRVR